MTIIVVATIDVDPAHAERMLREAQPLIEASQAEPGCLAYTWALNPFFPGRMEVFEMWVDEAALAHHFTLPNYLDMGPLLNSAGEIRYFTANKLRGADMEPIYDAEGKPRADFFTKK